MGQLKGITKSLCRSPLNIWIYKEITIRKIEIIIIIIIIITVLIMIRIIINEKKKILIIIVIIIILIIIIKVDKHFTERHSTHGMDIY